MPSSVVAQEQRVWLIFPPSLETNACFDKVGRPLFDSFHLACPRVKRNGKHFLFWKGTAQKQLGQLVGRHAFLARLGRNQPIRITKVRKTKPRKNLPSQRTTRLTPSVGELKFKSRPTRLLSGFCRTKLQIHAL